MDQMINIDGIPINQQRLWKYPDCAQFLQRSEHTLRRDVMYNRIPYVRIGRTIRFIPGDIIEWVKSGGAE